MKNFKIKITILFVIIFASCQDDTVSHFQANQTLNSGDEKKVQNGRFVFSSKASLESAINQIKEQGVEHAEKEFEKLYNQGFRSHAPIVNSENEELQIKLSSEFAQKKKLHRSSDLLDDSIDIEQGFIADPILASLVNSNNEIIVNDTLYKFTKKQGLFFSHVNDSTDLFSYFDKSLKQNSHDNPYMLREVFGGVTKMTNKVSRFIPPVNIQKTNKKRVFEANSEDLSYLSRTSEEELQKIINSLPICEGKKNWFQNIFGKSYACYSKFDRRRRVKTEFWDQNWRVYRSAGILVKTQRKRFGIWMATKSDELHLGINKIYLKYKHKKPELNVNGNNFGYSPEPIFLYQNNFKMKAFNNNYIDAQVIVKKNSLPFFYLNEQDLLNIYLPLGAFGNIDFSYGTQDITSESNVKALYKLGIDFLKKHSGSKKKFAVTVQKNNEEIEVLYFAERYSATNKKTIKRKFYKDVSFVISITKNGDNPLKFGVSPETGSGFRDYTHYELDFYGMARRGSKWRGNRMIRN